MPLTTEEILERVSEALAYAASVDGWLSEIGGDYRFAGYEGPAEAYTAVQVLTDLERDLTSDILEESVKLP